MALVRARKQAAGVQPAQTLRTCVRRITVEDFCVFIARVCHGDVSSSLAAPATCPQVGCERVAAAANDLDTSPWRTRARKSVNPIPVLSVDGRIQVFRVLCPTNCVRIERRCVHGPREGAFKAPSSTSGAQIHHPTFTGRKTTVTVNSAKATTNTVRTAARGA